MTEDPEVARRLRKLAAIHRAEIFELKTIHEKDLAEAALLRFAAVKNHTNIPRELIAENSVLADEMRQCHAAELTLLGEHHHRELDGIRRGRVASVMTYTRGGSDGAGR